MLKVLLVDDEYYFRKALIKLLTDTDDTFEVFAEASNGKDALKLMPDADLVFLDINIPQLNGIEVLEKSSMRGDKCTIIILTVYTEFEYVKKAINLGALDYILKPVNKDELQRVLHKAKDHISIKNAADVIASSGTRNPNGDFFSEPGDKKPQPSLSSLRADLFMALRSRDIGSAMELIKMNLSPKSFSPDEGYLIMMEIVSTCMEFCNENGIDFNNDGISSAALQILINSKSIAELYEWLINLITDCINKLTIKKTISSNKNPIVENVMTFIKDNYGNSELNVNYIAQKLAFNYHYLGKLFSQQTGISIKKYIIQVRMKKAKELFDSGSTNAQDTAYLVGYDDPGYFNKCFKAYYGITPTQYIENVRD